MANKFFTQVEISTASGVAPLVVSSTTLVTNLNSQYLGGQLGSYYLDTSATAQTKTGNLTISGNLIVSGTTTTKSNGTATGRPMLMFTQTIGDGYATSFTLTHNFNTQDVVVQVRRLSDNLMSGSFYGATVTAGAANSITITFGTAPTTNQYRVVIIG